MTNPASGRMKSSALLLNILGSVGLGFSGFILMSHLVGIISGMLGGLMDGRQTWDVLASDSISPYGFMLTVASGTAFVLIGQRSISRKVMGYPQIVLILVAVSIPIIWDYLID